MDLENLGDKDLDTGSPAVTADEDTLALEGADGGDAGSSPADGENDTPDALAVVRDVVSAKSDTPASPAEGAETGADAGDPTKQKDEDDYSDVPFHAHPRFKKLITERNALRDEAKTAQADATEYRKITGFLDQSGMSYEEAADGLSIMAQGKVDPAGAWQRLRPYVQKLLIAAGEVLPDDLSAQVQRGEITPEAAMQLSRTTAQVEAMRAQQTFAQQQAEARANSERVQARVGAAEAWQNDRAAKDPNFQAKMPLVVDVLKAIQFDEGVPEQAAGVKEQLDRAYKRANEMFRPPAPTVVPTRRPTAQPTSSGQVAGTPTAKPQSTLDIIRAARQARVG